MVIGDKGLEYDNRFFFNIDPSPKAKVLAIGDITGNWLQRMYTPDDFIFSATPLEQLKYSDINTQDLIILNGLPTLPNPLRTALKEFNASGGSLVIIPALEPELNAYNTFLGNMDIAGLTEVVSQKTPISGIRQEHPLFQGVFEGQVANFQYPEVEEYFTLERPSPTVLSYQNGRPFLVARRGVYLFTASLTEENSNFKRSPLVVPVFYNIGLQSLKKNPLYSIIGQNMGLDVPVELGTDDILNLTNGSMDFIPQQRLLPNKVRLTFGELPNIAGSYRLMNKGEGLGHISFNHKRTESALVYIDPSEVLDTEIYDSVGDFLNTGQNASAMDGFWKWFAILALVFVLLETLLHKFLN